MMVLPLPCAPGWRDRSILTLRHLTGASPAHHPATSPIAAGTVAEPGMGRSTRLRPIVDGGQRVVARSSEQCLQVRTPHANVAAVEQRVGQGVSEQIEEGLSLGVALDAD